MAKVPEGVAEQQTSVVAQLQAERENAEALGLTDRVAAVDKQLKSLDVKAKAAQERKAAAEESDDEEPKKVVPQDRSVTPLETAEEPVKRGPGRPRKNVE